MNITDENKTRAARLLLEINAVNINPAKPFTYTSGLVSPIYIDCRKVISHPKVRSELMDQAVSIITKHVDKHNLSALAGGETAGIPFSAILSQKMNLPMLYVRKKPKGFGRNMRIEGDVDFIKSKENNNSEVLLVEDLASNGQSKIDFCLALREAGFKLSYAFVIFNYDLFKSSDSLYKKSQITLLSLTNIKYILEVANNLELIPKYDLNSIEEFLESPKIWSNNHGGI